MQQWGGFFLFLAHVTSMFLRFSRSQYSFIWSNPFFKNPSYALLPVERATLLELPVKMPSSSASLRPTRPWDRAGKRRRGRVHMHTKAPRTCTLSLYGCDLSKMDLCSPESDAADISTKPVMSARWGWIRIISRTECNIWRGFANWTFFSLEKVTWFGIITQPSRRGG